MAGVLFCLWAAARWVAENGSGYMQELAVFGVGMYLEENYAAAIWTALAVLPSLRKVQWEVVGKFDYENSAMELYGPKCQDTSSFLQHLTKLTQIR